MVATMAKKRTDSKPRSGSDARQVIASLKGSEEFDQWMEELAEFLRLPKTVLIEHGLVELARARGFKKPPPRR